MSFQIVIWFQDWSSEVHSNHPIQLTIGPYIRDKAMKDCHIYARLDLTQYTNLAFIWQFNKFITNQAKSIPEMNVVGVWNRPV